MSAARECSKHGFWVDDGTTLACPECIAETAHRAELQQRREMERRAPRWRIEAWDGILQLKEAWIYEQISNEAFAEGVRRILCD